MQLVRSHPRTPAAVSENRVGSVHSSKPDGFNSNLMTVFVYVIYLFIICSSQLQPLRIFLKNVYAMDN